MKSTTRQALGFTVFFVLLYKGLGLISLPYLPADSFNALMQRMIAPQESRSSILSLGWGPLANGFLLVELCALLIPFLKRLRQGGISGRRRLNIYGLYLALLISLVDAAIVARLHESSSPIWRGPSAFALFVMMASLVGGVLITWLIANAITRWGFGNGFVVLMLPSSFYLFGGLAITQRDVVDAFRSSIPVANVNQFLGFIALGIVVFFLARYLTRRSTLSVKTGNEDTEMEIPKFPQGVLPLSVGPAIILFATSAWSYQFGMSPEFLSRSSWVYIDVLLVLIVVLSGLFFLGLNDYPRLRNNLPTEVQISRAPVMALLRDNLKWSLIIFLALLLLLRFLTPHISLVGLIVIFTIGFDLVREWKFRESCPDGVAIVELDNAHLAAYAAGRLRGHDIPHFIQAYHYRRLYFLFQPLIKMRLFVRGTDEEKALNLLNVKEWTVV